MVLRSSCKGQPFEILALLLQRPGRIVTREELHKKLWPGDTFVDFEHGLNAAVNKLRVALGDSAENPVWIDTLPRRGYRFIAPVENSLPPEALGPPSVDAQLAPRTWTLRLALFFGLCVLLAGAGLFLYRRQPAHASPERTLTRVTFDDGLQIAATWSPDGRFLAYSSDRGGKFDIWVQQISGGDPVKITKGAANNWQPDWSPDGKYIAYRSEDGEGALYIVPSLGGAGMERKIASFGNYPRWSPDSLQILFQSRAFGLSCEFYIVGLDGNPPHPVQTDLTDRIMTMSAAWHPDGKRISVWAWEMSAEEGLVETLERSPNVFAADFTPCRIAV
jgi:dipeptidyl aminopeptidase/acylaminoacyl peptidase